MCVWLYVHMCVYMHICMHIRTYVCVCGCVDRQGQLIYIRGKKEFSYFTADVFIRFPLITQTNYYTFWRKSRRTGFISFVTTGILVERSVHVFMPTARRLQSAYWCTGTRTLARSACHDTHTHTARVNGPGITTLNDPNKHCSYNDRRFLLCV
jgi:hypothetical protein